MNTGIRAPIVQSEIYFGEWIWVLVMRCTVVYDCVVFLCGLFLEVRRAPSGPTGDHNASTCGKWLTLKLYRICGAIVQMNNL
ncbi:uncharacterized protein BO66DRAFT_92320 [Aspergillus aculeatinus CBS 121060]|uniref:Uncharacterized protein n=1 Tax=Aspergillus aculeatinus CBS 121060 TaxID=1448322 RepID=A0ACD1HA35_9EURO|nr:hypothetical protein BO66DRAFT_92320 [Aspergillus aculeatinus CBS 121060]RAH70240.1 hypothetical protein BO66DRAFT_92320 [Aspergillus aculeatinus CBS 121060]